MRYLVKQLLLTIIINQSTFVQDKLLHVLSFKTKHYICFIPLTKSSKQGCYRAGHEGKLGAGDTAALILNHSITCRLVVSFTLPPLYLPEMSHRCRLIEWLGGLQSRSRTFAEGTKFLPASPRESYHDVRSPCSTVDTIPTTQSLFQKNFLIQWTLELRPAWHTNNLGYYQNFSFDLRTKSWVTTRMPV
jgi:hypothetical protein